MTFRNMIRQELRKSQVARQNEMHSLEQGSQLQAFGGAGRVVQRISANILKGSSFCPLRNYEDRFLSLEKLEMFDVLAPCLEMKEHLPANL